jgi:hypothetical protein
MSTKKAKKYIREKSKEGPVSEKSDQTGTYLINTKDIMI